MSAVRTGRRLAAAARLGGVLAAVMAGAGCSRHAADPPPPPPPAVLEPASGSKLPVVKLSEQAFRAVQVQTVPAQAASAGVVIPTAAVIYSPDGAAWTYVGLTPRSYVRQAIVIARISGSEAFLSSGPPAGTPVVTMGAPELLGAEYGVGEE